MHRNHRRWTALAGAATISLAGLSTGAGTAVAEERPPLAWPVVQQKASTYSLDGFRIGYLPSGLERYGIHAKSSTGRHGARTSYISWVQGRDATYGKVTVIRDERIGTLEDLRERNYGHLERTSLRKVRNGEADAYLAEESGDMFWVPQKGVAVSTYLQPEKWDVEELTRFAESVRERQPDKPEESEESEESQQPEPSKPADSDSGEEPADDPKAQDEEQQPAPEEDEPQDTPQEKPQEDEPAQDQQPQEEQPAAEGEQPAEDKPAEEPAQEKPAQDQPVEEQPAPEKPADAQPVAEKPADDTAQQKEQRPNASAERIRVCLTEELPTQAEGTDGEGATDSTRSGTRATAQLWRSATEAERTRAADTCVERLNVGRDAVDAVIADMLGTHEEDTPQDSGDASQSEQDTGQDETADESGDAGEMTGSTTWADLWDSMPWTLPGMPSNR